MPLDRITTALKTHTIANPATCHPGMALRSTLAA